MKAQIYRRADGLWGLRLVGDNGEKISAFEGYSSKSHAERALHTVWEDFVAGEVDIEVEDDAQESETRIGEAIQDAEGETSS